MSSYNPNSGFESPFSPNYDRPYGNCDCGQAPACGNRPEPKAFGKMYEAVQHQSFAAWNGSLAASDLHPRVVKPYRPPALPYVCDRPIPGSSLCASSMKCNP